MPLTHGISPFVFDFSDSQYNLGENTADWLGSEDDPLKGFSWCGGSDRHTTGLLLWSQPFKATLPNGEEVSYSFQTAPSCSKLSKPCTHYLIESLFRF